MFEQTFKNIDNAFREDDGCSTELDYAEQSSWILFLKWLDDYEKEKETKAKLENKQFKPTLKKEKLTTRDSRVVERKKYGHKKARRSFQFSKR